MILDIVNSLGFSTTDWAISALSAVIIGMSKAGISGAGAMVVPIMAVVFGGKPSTGIVLPMLIIADIFAVLYYSRYTNWKLLIKLIPWSFCGILIAMVVGNHVTDANFKLIMSIVILVGVVIMVWRDLKKTVTIPDYWWFAMVLGLSGGFATMIGNAAGPMLSLYLLSMRISKNNFIGTGAWFFLLVNVFKVPLHVFSWETITRSTVLFDLMMAPAIIVGVFLGIVLVRLMPEKFFRALVIGTTVLSAVLLIR